MNPPVKGPPAWAGAWADEHGARQKPLLASWGPEGSMTSLPENSVDDKQTIREREGFAEPVEPRPWTRRTSSSGARARDRRVAFQDK